jgi:hypothetical protein
MKDILAGRMSDRKKLSLMPWKHCGKMISRRPATCEIVFAGGMERTNFPALVAPATMAGVVTDSTAESALV